MKFILVSEIAPNCNYLTPPQSFPIEGGIITHSWIDNNGVPVLHITAYNLNEEVLTDDYYTF